MSDNITSIERARPLNGDFERGRAGPASTIAPDRDLLRLVLEAKALDRELAQAETDLASAMSRVTAPCVPGELTVTAFDTGAFARLQLRSGDSLSLLDVNTIRAFRDGLVQLVGETPLPNLRRIVERANEIDMAAERYFARAAGARLAAGVIAAENRATSCAEALGRLYTRIARTPAQTLLGVLAKLDAVAVPLAACVVVSDEGEMDEPSDVAIAAAADLAALTGGARPVLFDLSTVEQRGAREGEDERSDVELLALVAEGRRWQREINVLLGDQRTISEDDQRKLHAAGDAYQRALAAAVNTVPQSREGLREVLAWVRRQADSAALPGELLKAFLRSASTSPALRGV